MRHKLRSLGFSIGSLPTGKRNQITDVPGVRVGHVTIREDIDERTVIRTGVTAVLPHEGNLFLEKVPAACFVLNGFGKTAGLVQVEELGVIESPVMLTNTFSVGEVWQGTLEYMLAITPEIGDTTGSINIVVGECNDSYLNTARALAVTKEHAKQAIANARVEMEEGVVGAGTGMMCFGWKGGVGSSSRIAGGMYTVGALVVSNFGRREELQFVPYVLPSFNERDMPPGSIMMIVATDAPLDARQLKRLAKRAAVGLARTGSRVHHGSGDIVIAFSNAYTIPHFSDYALQLFPPLVRDDALLMNELFQAAIEATEEAIWNSLTTAETTTGRNGRVGEAIPYSLLRRMGR
ncbi:P1 family peptidase [Geobacillus sp. TFV-3]|uniref:DmpA family aminopeptidase n=1 Tax=Geobacillus sp. TFV-3 TaxID=1897059 RepID=UPI0013586DBD|nr:P1 family peptidase [Geobacillus sp. TFV-3]KAF0993786.1 Beta-peptidyl aminopeptidase BapA [Geobacillus sp. TFV-3]